MPDLRPMRRLVLTSALLLFVSACASNPVLPPAQSFEGRDEKAMLAVLRNVEATDPQREKILAAYDRYNPAMLGLAQQWRELGTEWERLDRRDPGFVTAADALAARRTAVAGEQIRLASAFEQEIAATLTAGQWKDWQELWSLVGDPHEVCGGPGGSAPGAYRGRRR
jgi:hypothetical protein